MKKIISILLLLFVCSVQGQTQRLNALRVQQASVSFDLKDGLFMCLEFDETSGATAFDVHGSNNFSNANATINQAGIIDKSYLFNGSNSILSNLTIGSEIASTNTISISMWVNTTSTTVDVLMEYSSVWSSNNAFSLFMQSGTLYTGQANGGLNRKNITGVDDGTWNNIIVIFDRNESGADQTKLYINGVSGGVSDLTDTLSGVFGNYNMYIGARSGNSLNYDGKTDQTAIWGRAITSDEIDAVYNSGLGLSYSSW